MKTMNYNISNFDEIREKIVENRKKELNKQNEFIQENNQKISVMEPQPKIDAKHELTPEEAADAEKFRDEHKELRHGKKLKGMKKFDMISGTVFKSKAEDFMTDQITLQECKRVRDEMNQIFTIASTYTTKFLEEFAPALLTEENKGIRETFVEVCGTLSSYEIANMNIDEARIVIDPVKETFVTAPMMQTIDELSELDLTNNDNDTVKFFLGYAKDIISQIKSTVTIQVGVDAVIPILTKYLESLIIALGYGETKVKAGNDEINKLKFSVNACREKLKELISAKTVEFNSDELDEELEYIESLTNVFNIVDDFTPIYDYIERMGKKIKVDLKKGKDVENVVNKFGIAMIQSKRRYPIPGVVETASEVRAVLYEFITSTMLSYDFGEYYAANLGKDLKAVIEGYDNDKTLFISKEPIVSPVLDSINLAKETIQKLYVVNNEITQPPFSQFLAELFPKKFEYFRNRSIALLFIISKIYARGGRIDEAREYELILIMEVVAKLVFGENARRVAGIYRKLDDVIGR